jgi:hypothetical protein
VKSRWRRKRVERVAPTMSGLEKRGIVAGVLLVPRDTDTSQAIGPAHARARVAIASEVSVTRFDFLSS